MPPEKKYYKTGEVVEMTGLEPHVLRTWEAEIPQLKTKKNRAGHRVFTKANIDLILEIKNLIQVDGYTVAGAAKRLHEKNTTAQLPFEGPDTAHLKQEIKEVRLILENMKKMLDRGDEL